jgi:hypothetical protein
MKRILLILLVLPIMAFSQDDEKHGHFQVGAGFGFGIFFPSEINDYMSEYFDDHDISLNYGSTELFMNLGGRIFMGYQTKFNLGIEAFLEGAVAPKSVKVTNGSDFAYSMNRMSPGAKLYYSIPVSRVFKIIVGAGPTYNRLKFTLDGNKLFEQKGVIGTKVGIAFQFNARHFAPRVAIDYDMIKGNAKYIDNYGAQRSIEMNYSGIQIGLCLSGLFY